ncbi:protein of unknown function DUF1256 [Desulforamulus reducens MI-1]|uniref:Sporulation protein YyaC n=1 Tax=Desulforamulus reducens (strain ATCC BAA-1160 / DSM 100696 / MI-1) TaxID=349161 RepID=A4J9R1_DESRM|nr:spore protease YyaC [Desulforamulus reducens]ABO51814.1 protein of unknown function DUF1256 [Desulforamulus reducens MI-1]
MSLHIDSFCQQAVIPAKTRISIEDALGVDIFSMDLVSRLKNYGVESSNEVVIVCIGTDRSTGDCLGPLVGTKMTSQSDHDFVIYGTLDDPVHASNLNDKLDFITKVHPNAIIIAIDACLGHLENVGCINIGDGSLFPGAGVKKSLPAVGQIHITGVVNVGGFMEYLVLQNTRLNLVMRLADLIKDGLIKTSQLMKTETRSC